MIRRLILNALLRARARRHPPVAALLSKHAATVAPEHIGATAEWSPLVLLDAAPADWDDAARTRAEEAQFWDVWNTKMDRIQADLRAGLNSVELRTRAFLTGGHTQDNRVIDIALASAS